MNNINILSTCAILLDEHILGKNAWRSSSSI